MADAPPKYEFAKLELKAGDVLVVKMNCARLEASPKRMQDLRDAAERIIPEGVCVFCVGPEVDLMTITREQAGPLIEGTAKPLKPAKAKK